MSAETLRAIDDAIQAHLRSESEGHIATGWVAYVAAESMSDATKSFYRSLVHESQPYHSTLGLVRMLQADYEYISVTADDED
jgi:hypothetical protein